jgi:hypothetical protein
MSSQSTGGGAAEGSPATAAEVFFAWERLRVGYNAVLLGFGVGWLLLFGPPTHLLFWPRLLEEAVIANLAFCAGPVAEGYLCWVGFPRRPARYTLFAAGTALAGGLALASLRHLHALDFGGGFFS